MKCPFCGAENADGTSICIYCGSQLPQRFESTDLKFCRYCGNKIPEDAVICVYCGRQVEELKKQQEPQQYANAPVVPQVIIYTIMSKQVKTMAVKEILRRPKGIIHIVK